MVRARSLGRKWVLGACGRALFADVAARYKAGIGDFEFPNPAQGWEAARPLGRHVAETCQRQIGSAVRLKASAEPHIITGYGVRQLGCFLYVSALAESRGFASVVETPGTTWERAVFSLRAENPGWVLHWPFQLFKASYHIYNPGLAFDPMKEFATFKMHSDKPYVAVMLQHLDFGGTRSLVRKLCEVSLELLGAEVMSTIFLTQFLQTIHLPMWRNNVHLMHHPFAVIILDFE